MDAYQAARDTGTGNRRDAGKAGDPAGIRNGRCRMAERAECRAFQWAQPTFPVLTIERRPWAGLSPALTRLQKRPAPLPQPNSSPNGCKARFSGGAWTRYTFRGMADALRTALRSPHSPKHSTRKWSTGFKLTFHRYERELEC